MRTRSIWVLGSLILFTACNFATETDKEKKTEVMTPKVQVQGHRGDRGNFPENSLPAFISAVEKGVDVLELDVVISKDKKVVVSHEPFMSSHYMLTPEGEPISKEMERQYNHYKMNYDSIRRFDGGSRGNTQFPQQQRIKTFKPLLSEVIDSVESFIIARAIPSVSYNIELKSSESLYDEFQPAPAEFVELVMEVVKEKGIEEKSNIQSFDIHILKEMHREYPHITLAYLVSDGGIETNLVRLGFQPQIYSPHYSLVKDSLFVDSVRRLGMKLIPWTVNDPTAIDRMLDLRVDGIITDFPERVLQK